MDLDILKTTYNKGNEGILKTPEELNKMQHSGKHPVLKKMKRQLVVESILWTLVLLVFYDFFDGHQKSLFWNLLLVVSIFLLLTHNILGFLILKNPIQGVSLKISLENYFVKIKNYATTSIISRAFAVITFVLYLTSNTNWNTSKLWLTISFMALLIFIQIFALNKIWKNRLSKIKKQITDLE